MSVELAVVADTQSKQDENPYEEYMWMGEEELEFEQDVLAQLEEEELMQNYFQDMLEEEELGLFNPPPLSSTTSSSTTLTSSSSSLPPIENLSIGTTNGINSVHHGNGDVILMPASEVAYDAGGGGDGQYGERRKETDSYEKNENLSDSDSSEGCPQR